MLKVRRNDSEAELKVKIYICFNNVILTSKPREILRQDSYDHRQPLYRTLKGRSTLNTNDRDQLTQLIDDNVPKVIPQKKSNILRISCETLHTVCDEVCELKGIGG